MKDGLPKVLLMFFFSVVLFVLASFLINLTWGSIIGMTVIYAIGIVLIVFGVVVLVQGIRDLIKVLFHG